MSGNSMERNEDYFQELEKMRKNALGERDNLRYFNLCDELGVEAEAKDLYDQGQLEFDLETRREKNLEKLVFNLSKKTKKKRKRSVPNKRYGLFYSEASDLSCNIGSQSDDKRELMIKYFPRRFGDKGTTPVCKLDYLQIGSLFNQMVSYSEKRAKE